MPSAPRSSPPYDADDPLARALDANRRATARPEFRQSLRRQLMTAPAAQRPPVAWFPRLALGPAAVVAFLMLAGTVLAASLVWRMTHPTLPPAPPVAVATVVPTRVVVAPVVQPPAEPSATASPVPTQSTQPAPTERRVLPRRQPTATITATASPTVTATLVPATEPEPEEPTDEGPPPPLATPTEPPVTGRPTFPPEPTEESTPSNTPAP